MGFNSGFKGLKGKAIPLQAWTGPEGSRRLRLPDFNRHMKVVRLSALRNGRFYPQEIFLVLISVRKLSQPQGHSAAGRIMSMKNSNDTIGNRTRDLPTCSAVPQSTALPAACPQIVRYVKKIIQCSNILYTRTCARTYRTCSYV